jgi:hypothetical protein
VTGAAVRSPPSTDEGFLRMTEDVRLWIGREWVDAEDGSIG